MDRLVHTTRIVAAALKNNPHIQISELPDLIRSVHDALPVVRMPARVEGAKPEPITAQAEPEEPIQPEASDDEPDAPTGRVSWSDAMASARARLGGGMSHEERVASAASGTAAARDAVLNQSDDDAEAETEAHAS